MRITFLNKPADMAWLHEVHSVPADMRCAILTGNEDCPSKIEAWRDPDPAHDAPPDFTSGE